VAIGVYAVIPYAHFVNIGERTVYFGIAPNINIGVLFILAMTSIGVYGITLAGWASNSKYSLLGGLRSAAQMISYELSMGLSLLGVILITGTLSLNEIVIFQRDAWYGFRWLVFLQPLGFIIFMVSSFAETNRTPFDLPEAEPELVGGYNTEYSGMKFGMFFLAEYANMATASAFMALLYFGGWSLPFPEFWDSIGYTEGTWARVLLQFGSFFVKLMIFIFFFIWVRWTVPRFRYDQLMHLGWKVLLPLSIINLFVTAAVIILFGW
jgi:NADH-quinone oxidoreductase subunit H